MILSKLRRSEGCSVLSVDDDEGTVLELFCIFVVVVFFIQTTYERVSYLR